MNPSSFSSAGWTLRAVGALALCACLDAVAAEPTPTVIVDIHALGFDGVEAIKSDAGVRWSAEFGNEMLLGVDRAYVDRWLARPRVRAGLGQLAREEILVRDHLCADLSVKPAMGVVGGYEILREPASLVRYAARTEWLNAVPDNGVYSREVANSPELRRVLGADPAIAAITARVNVDRWFAQVESLAAFNRNTLSPALPAARMHIQNQFIDAQLVSESFNFNFAGVTACGSPPPTLALVNPIGRKIGSQLADEWIVVGAHYDSRNVVRCDGNTAPQPGANDNASGCAGVIELARVFQGVSTARSILFMCFAGEEQGLIGSRRYVESLQASGEIARVKHMINLDMIGYAVNDSLAARVDTNSSNQALINQYVDAAQTYAPELSLITSITTSANSDHWYFLNAGVPSAFTWENGAGIYPHYHQETDIPANMTRAKPLAGGILKMDAAVLAQVAGLVVDSFKDGFEE